jgi:4-alpha-glucanotransferase
MEFFELLPSADHWRRVGFGHRAGLCVPVWCLHSARSAGCGDFQDLLDLLPQLPGLGVGMLQLLPLNDLGLDSCPYSALSAFALDPVYIAPERLPGFKQDAELAAALKRLQAADSGAAVDWQRVRRSRDELLRQAWRRLGASLAPAVAAFAATAGSWLPEYLDYKARKVLGGYRSWEDFGPAPEAPALKAEMDFQNFLQWAATTQMEAVHALALAHGVLLQGDIPILVSRDSADVRSNPRYFRLDTSAGAPPDMYSPEGQNWGFPTYDWDALRADGFGWWRARLAHAQRFFDCYRIDHVVGFFRIWTIPWCKEGQRSGRDGVFVPADEATWGAHGEALLRMMLDATTMLPLAEDLGVIPDCCRQTLANLGICGLKIQRWERRWHGDRSFIHPKDQPALSVLSLSTHDSETALQWWAANQDEARLLWDCIGEGQPFPGPGQEARALRTMLAAQAKGASAFRVQVLGDLLDAAAADPCAAPAGRINIPATVGPHNWSWRCPVPVADLGATLKKAGGL